MNEASYPDPQSICDVVELVASVTLGLGTSPIRPPDPATWSHGEMWTGCVGVAGAFCGAITVACTKEFAYRATRVMLETDSVDDEGARDVLAELTNVIGGNLKSLLAEASGRHSSLSTPTVTIGNVSVPNAAAVREQWCDLGGDPIRITLFEARPTVERAR